MGPILDSRVPFVPISSEGPICSHVNSPSVPYLDPQYRTGHPCTRTSSVLYFLIRYLDPKVEEIREVEEYKPPFLGLLEAKDIIQVSTSLSDVTLLLQARCHPDCRPHRPCRPCYTSSSLYSSIMPRIHQIRRHSAASMISSASRLRFGEISSFTPLKTRSHSADITG